MPKRVKNSFSPQAKVAFQGEPGAYSEEAIFFYFNTSVKTIAYKTFLDVFEALKKDEVDFAVVPLENSLEGTVGSVYDLFLKYTLSPYAEIFLRIRHCLISFPQQTLRSIKGVYSHYQALGQCRRFLEKKKYKAIPFYDTAASVRLIKEKKMTNWAAIASKRAAQIYGMKVLREGIEDNLQNFTRFLVLSKKEREPTGRDKTSVIFGLKHVPGSLFRVLKIFARRKINLTKLESRPLLGSPWEYNFILEFEGHRKEKKMKIVLKELAENTTFLKIIGSFPAGSFDKK